ncbi:hypothetical protein ACLB2K_027777 [Fragaria x ananassa]
MQDYLASKLNQLHLYRFADEERSEHVLIHDLESPTEVTITGEGVLVTSEELPFVDVETIKIATDDFSDSNKLGQGGFGTVYKGVVPDGKEVAVKRLSRKSWQGLEEFKNEVILIAKLQHRNLVRLLACGFEGEEKLLLYEFMPNKSLNTFIFESQRRAILSWETYHNIIKGIARGLLYLHEDSRLRIIHRDLKPGNVLLDHGMVAKISDLGMARILCANQNTANTKRVVGTCNGYMAPEYEMEGLFSVKFDVFSFGAWNLWKDGKEVEFVEPSLLESSPTKEILRCMHIGLLCLQEDPKERPTMSDVVVLLGSDSIELPEPKKPAIFAASRIAPIHESSTSCPTPNGLTLSIILPRPKLDTLALVSDVGLLVNLCSVFPFWGRFAARVILASGLLPALHSLDIHEGLTRNILPGMIFGDRAWCRVPKSPREGREVTGVKFRVKLARGNSLMALRAATGRRSSR